MPAHEPIDSDIASGDTYMHLRLRQRTSRSLVCRVAPSCAASEPIAGRWPRQRAGRGPIAGSWSNPETPMLTSHELSERAFLRHTGLQL